MGRETERAAALSSLVPPRGTGDPLDDVAEAPRVDRMLLERLAIVGQLFDTEI